ncbi:MAG: LuxR C-terminal-related transcriptional regulator, partial [Anaerolineae bacterium]|nr:LuxR C-terminal-related transcriptional regulator [Anaerolineae bacterium]
TAHLCLGALYLDLLQSDTARRHLETAYDLAAPLGSPTVSNVVLGYLIKSHIVQQDFDPAHTLLDEVLTPATPLHSKPQRHLWWAKAELHLAQGEAAEALQIVDQLIATPPVIEEEVARRRAVIPSLWYVRGKALVALGYLAEAEQVFREGYQEAQAQGMRPLCWRIQAELAQLYHKQRRRELAQATLAEAQALIQAWAAPLDDATVQANFLRQAMARLPALSPPTRLQAAKQAYDGLTAREREVATLIAQGKSNRAIAEALFVQERTAAKHVENILSKLGYTSRAQIAVWAVEKALVAPEDGQ